MSCSRDNPNPALIVNGPQQQKQAPVLNDPKFPNNDDDPDNCDLLSTVPSTDT
ncbi:hypothetical protein DFH09DRAFT_1312439 [Mycena vulgaris]|nr:hypothetical protein DFH09DRAFT_1312439 [Mycena vulgaris]